MRKTLLLVFIHGFKGGDDTFGTFPSHIRALISHALPQINITTVQYPRFETRGDLKESVARFREWLENKVIDLEVANTTPSPTVDPSVHVILVGHSMGGIVAAETLLLLANERPISATPSNSRQNKEAEPPQTPPFMFPHVQGVLAFDTPYLGLAPEMVAHSLEGGHKAVASAWGTATEVASIFGLGGKATTNTSRPNYRTTKSVGALSAPPVAVSNAMDDAAAVPRWQSLGKYAMFAGAAGAVAAGGAAALYAQREKISAGWSWATSHLLFVGDLAKGELLKKRVADLERVVGERSLGGWVNLYTNLGRGAREGYGITETIAGKDRTFCNLPLAVKEASSHRRTDTSTNNNSDNKDTTSRKSKLRWIKTVNDKAKDETAAHISMFFPRDNPGFYALGDKTVEVVCDFIDRGWYESSNGDNERIRHPHSSEFSTTHSSKETSFSPATFTPGSLGRDWEGLDDEHHAESHEVDEDVEMRDEESGDEDQDNMEGSVIVQNMRSSGHTNATAAGEVMGGSKGSVRRAAA